MKRFFTLQNLFLLVIIVILPVCVAYYSINNMIEEQYTATVDSVSASLRQQIARIQMTTTAEYQIKDFFMTIIKQKLLCRQTPEIIKEFIDSVEKSYPGAFKWLFLDENYEVISIKSKGILEAVRIWRNCLKGGIYIYNRIRDGNGAADYQEVTNNYYASRPLMQKMMGSGEKPEHIFEHMFSPYKSKWTGKDCYIIWGVDGISHNKYGIAEEISGSCVMMVIPDMLPKDFWYKRMIVRRQKSREHFEFPIAAINLSDNTAVAMDPVLPTDNFFLQELINAYNFRSKDVFEFKNFLVGTSPFGNETEIRVMSMADLTDVINHKNYMKLMLSLACAFLVVISIGLTVYVKSIRFVGIPLRQRIAAIFLMAMLLPILSLISVGKTFIVHEDGRLKESAYVKMRAGLEALGMHYTDTPRLIERGLYQDLLSKIPKGKPTVEMVSKAMFTAVDEGIINQFVFFKDGEIAAKSWQNLEPTLEKSLKYMANQTVKDYKNDGFFGKASESNKKLLEEYVDDEISELIGTSGSVEFSMDLPSHLRHFVYLDQHLYFMTLKVVIDEQICPLFVYLPDKLVEKNFAAREFTTNNMAAQEEPGSIVIPELSFYSTLPGVESFPSESPLWIKLKTVLDRSSELKIEETGIVRIEEEDFLYLAKPLSSMNSKSYLPCLLTSTKPIELRVRQMGILIFALSAFAIIGSILLSFALSSSLLTPIKKIDSAAQQIGKGNLDVVLPEEGSHDELSRLSITFNEMVKGLREREKMQAYVSDSVLEAVKDTGDQTVHAGKHIEATILFSDIRNFTGISEANPPDKVFQVLNEHFGGVEPIIRMYHGRVDKYIGDAVMAIFHQTLPEHHAISAIKAAYRMNQYVEMMNQKRIQRGDFPIKIGIGISTGQVLLGDIGSVHRKDLTVIGDEVNLASRLESASKQGKHSKIIFSGQTLKYLEDYVEVEKLPFEEIRGKKQAVQIYELVRFKDPNFMN